jgi:intracellular sulfur oxidation DsrE/DsrF family protein
MKKVEQGTIARRKLVAALGTGAVALGAAVAPGTASARDKTWKPAHEDQDAWMELPGKHRLVFDTTSTEGVGNALGYARNYIGINKSAYGIESSELATIIIVRHMSTVFGYNDAMWAKYGKVLSDMASFTDPKTKEVPSRNLLDVKNYGPGLPNAGATISDLAGQGVQFAVCGAATERVAMMIANAVKADQQEIRKELGANLVQNGRIVPAGIVALNRAQERGYALAYYTV